MLFQSIAGRFEDSQEIKQVGYADYAIIGEVSRTGIGRWRIKEADTAFLGRVRVIIQRIRIGAAQAARELTGTVAVGRQRIEVASLRYDATLATQVITGAVVLGLSLIHI